MRERLRLAEIEQGFGLLEMGAEDLLEFVEFAGAGRLAPALGRAEAAQMAVADPGGGKMGGELVLGEALLARHRRRADVEHEAHARVAQRLQEGRDARALIADGVDRGRLHGRGFTTAAGPRHGQAGERRD